MPKEKKLQPAQRQERQPGREYKMKPRPKAAAKLNVKTAARSARRKRTVAHLPKKTRTALGKEGVKAARRNRG